MKAYLSTGVALAALASGTALAADLPVKAPLPAQVLSWTGFYAGINAGGSFGVNADTQSAAFASTALGANGLLSTADKHASPGALVGGQIGYNWQLPSR